MKNIFIQLKLFPLPRYKIEPKSSKTLDSIFISVFLCLWNGVSVVLPYHPILKPLCSEDGGFTI